MHVRVINLRKYVELTCPSFSETPIYEVLSNIVHGRTVALTKEGEKLSEDFFESGCTEMKQFLGNTYDEIINELSAAKLIELVEYSDTYEKVIAMRLLFERIEGLLLKLRKKYPDACKFLNETNHVENDYIFQLNPLKFFSIPQFYLQELEKFVIDEKKQILEL